MLDTVLGAGNSETSKKGAFYVGEDICLQLLTK